jgi:preprotein translocase subunit SecF
MIIDSQPENLYDKNILSIEGGSMATATTFVIVGAGLAGAKAAETLGVGILVGTYSSVFVATPLLVAFEQRSGRTLPTARGIAAHE